MHFRRGAVDFVRENDVAEDRPLLDDELLIVGLIHQRADEVRRQKIGRELDALETGVNAIGQTLHSSGLGQTRHAFDQDVAIGEEAKQHAVDQIILADDHPVNLFGQALKRFAGGLDALADLLDVEVRGGGGHAECPLRILLSMRVERPERLYNVPNRQNV